MRWRNLTEVARAAVPARRYWRRAAKSSADRRGVCPSRSAARSTCVADAVEPDHILGHSAVELFVTRTQALEPDFVARAEDLPAIAAICRRLDGMPLAIEFAAARAAALGVRQVTAGLRDRFPRC